MTGMMVRIRRLFREDDRAVVVALDHAQFQGALPGLQSMRSIVSEVVAGGADGVILNPGAARDCAEIYAGRCALIVRVTGACTSLNPSFDYHRQICSIEQAVSLGADSVIAMGFVGNDGEAASLTLLSKIAETCHRFGMPLIAEMLPAASDKFQDAESIGLAARAGYELGASIIKAYTTGTEADKRIISDCSLPFLAAGGPKSANPSEIASTAIAHGAAGVAFGRNVFGADDPQQVVRDLVREVHGV
ncbi:fructose-bisphosphate aldolase [Candidatus Bipolaricaulota bacterium]|nr:fructose-bisphosphate aldolase [Candidatus Bipolaricaulota bacterium]